MRRTKIVCTLGPSVESCESIRALIAAGMNVARVNCSHGDWRQRLPWIECVRESSPRLGPVAVLADLQGPKFRIGELVGGLVELRAEQEVTVGPGGDATLPISQPELIRQLSVGCHVLLGDGGIELELRGKAGDNFEALVLSGGVVRSRQGVTIPGAAYTGPVITDKDLNDIGEATKHGVDFIALSYVRSAADVTQLRDIVAKSGPDIKLCAKIETREALGELDKIIDASDLVMVARGDLGLQMPIAQVPAAQKRIIALCNRAGKPVITATQMLESMVQSPRPTRAEATDIANAILDGTDAVMLSAETAAGKYPIEAVKVLSQIAEEADMHIARDKIERDFRDRAAGVTHTEAVAHAVAELSAMLKPDAIITTTTSGQTARLVSKFRPEAPILCATWSESVLRQMAVAWGVQALYMPLPATTDEVVENAMKAFVLDGKLKKGDTVIVTAGVPPGSPGNTNLILVKTV